MKTYECPYSWGCNNKLKKTLNKYECIAEKCNKSYVKIWFNYSNYYLFIMNNVYPLRFPSGKSRAYKIIDEIIILSKFIK